MRASVARRPSLRRVVDAVGRRRLFGLDVLGGHRRPHEDEVVVEIGAVQDLAEHRIEKGFGQLGLLVVGQQADVMQLDFAPDFVGQFALMVFVFQDLHAFLHPRVVERDALAWPRPARSSSRASRNSAWRPGWPGGTGGNACRSRPASCARCRRRSARTAVWGRRRVVMVFDRVCRLSVDVSVATEADRHSVRSRRPTRARPHAGLGIPQRAPSASLAASHVIHIRATDAPTGYRGQLYSCVSANSSRPISMRRISLVPAPISYSLASRHRRPVGYSLM